MASKNNPPASSGADDVVLAVVDDGFRQMKGLEANGALVAHPSLARAGFTLSLIGGGDGDAGLGGYQTSGREYTVDPQIDGEDTRFDDFSTSEINRVLVHHTLHTLGLSGKRVVLATGLPFQSFFIAGSSEPHQPLIDRKMENLSQPVEPLGGLQPIQIIQQRVTAQGLVAYIDYVVDDNGNFKSDVEVDAPVAVIDIGGRTTDCVTVYGGGKLDHAGSGTGVVGISNVYDIIENELKRKFGASKIRLSTLEHVARYRNIRLRGQQHDVGDIVDAAVAEISQQIIRESKRRIGDAAEMQAVILVGGGAALMSNCLKEAFPHLLVPERPEFSNARGMLKYLKMEIDVEALLQELAGKPPAEQQRATLALEAMSESSGQGA
ncbi:plasmid segregation protein ParM domain-containing protein [Ectopseudomonas hydrolytica]|uniref:plasmid segregation protein ParM domain-containing protein n=1 Tax=Ectopseudomonas hydrolytica TaxID=2493633 RepID=UPI003C307B90